MKYHPIIFIGPMVRAIQEGRKTQTRRIVKPQPGAGVRISVFAPSGLEDGHGRKIKLKYCVGDRLWIRECFARRMGGFYYRADANLAGITWKPSIHMPRCASRITLEVTAIRLQRVQEISEEDAIAEGVQHGNVAGQDVDIDGDVWNGAYRKAFSILWDQINGARASWSDNPWVWAITFRRLE